MILLFPLHCGQSKERYVLGRSCRNEQTEANSEGVKYGETGKGIGDASAQDSIIASNVDSGEEIGAEIDEDDSEKSEMIKRERPAAVSPKQDPRNSSEG